MSSSCEVENAIRLPSGDHCGSRAVRWKGVCVNAVSAEPSAATRYTSTLSARNRVNTIACPSGDQLGRLSPHQELWRVSVVIAEPSGAMT